ncbi:protoporphyrinogen/coproporphyrinogen oxidase [Microbacterium aureliae]
MADSTESLPDLIALAHERHVVVIGAGVAGLVAALECAKVGLRVIVVDPDAGSAAGRLDLDGLAVPAAASDDDLGDAARSLLAELGLDDAIRDHAADRPWIAGLPLGAAPLPAETVLGIPANPWADDVRALIGWRGAWRAYLDRLRPPLTIGVERDLARLVGSRMGARILDRMVAPVVAGRFGLTPSDLDVDLAAPGLNTALTRTGSLAAAVAELRLSAPGASRGVLEGGMPRLADALRARLAELEVQVLVADVAGLSRRQDDIWEIETRMPADHAATSADPGAAPDLPEPPARIVADGVVLAASEGVVRALLAPLAELPATPAAVDVETVTMVVDAPQAGASARSVVFRVPGSGPAVAAVDETSRAPWLAAAAGPDRRVLRVSFGTSATAPATAALDDSAAVALAVAEAVELLGIPTVPRVRAAVRTRRTAVRPASAAGHAAGTAALRTALRAALGAATAEGAPAPRPAEPRTAGSRSAAPRPAGAAPAIAVVGPWLAGSELDRTIADAVAEADRVRRAVLWTGGAP